MTNEKKIKGMSTSTLALTLAELTSYVSEGQTFFVSPYDYRLDLDRSVVQWQKWLEEEVSEA